LGNFFVVVFAHDFRGEAAQLFGAGLDAARCLKMQVPNNVVETAWVHAASFARQNGSGTPIVTDMNTGSWLLTFGTWFHTENYATGAEARLLHRYLEIGAERLSRELEGFFVVVIGDARTRETFVLTDIVGSCHGFMRAWEHGIALSGSSLLLASLGDVRLDSVACQEFLGTGTIYEDRTIYQEVRKLGPASIFRFTDGALRATRCYWQITDLTPESLDGQVAVSTLGDTLVHAAQRVGGGFGRPVCDLTGGYDSRALVAAFLTARVPFSTTVSGPAESPDVVVSHGLAQLAGFTHIHLEYQNLMSFERIKEALPYTDGEYDLVEYACVLEIHQTLARRFDVSINGSFGEVARGYGWRLLFPHTGACHKLDAQQLAKHLYAALPYDPSLFEPNTRLNLVSHFAGIIARTNAGLSDLPNTLQMDHAYLMLRMQRWQGKIASSTNQLWPSLSPFLFRSVLETMLQATTRSRRRSLLIRKVLAALQPRLAAFPLEHGYPALPVTWRNVHRFWPVPLDFGKKVLAKVGSRVGGSRWRRLATSPDRLPARLHLWHDEDVQVLLQPATMRLGSVVNPDTLRAFLRRSQGQDFPWDAQWARVLSLEYALHRLAGVQAAHNILPRGTKEELP
jgi:hypothetical protein